MLRPRRLLTLIWSHPHWPRPRLQHVIQNSTPWNKLVHAQDEAEVVEIYAEFTKEYGVKPILEQGHCDFKTKKIIAEFKFDKILNNTPTGIRGTAKTLAQLLYYVRKQENPEDFDFLMVAGKYSARFFTRKECEPFYLDKIIYDWTRPPSNPCVKLRLALQESLLIQNNKLYILNSPRDFDLFCERFGYLLDMHPKSVDLPVVQKQAASPPIVLRWALIGTTLLALGLAGTASFRYLPFNNESVAEPLSQP